MKMRMALLAIVLIAVSVQWWAVDVVNWIFVAAAALVSAILSLFWGELFLRVAEESLVVDRLSRERGPLNCHPFSI